MEIWLLRVTAETMIALGATCWCLYRAERLMTRITDMIVRKLREER